MKIQVLDHIECLVPKQKGANSITPAISIKAEFWRQGKFSKVQHEYDKKLWSSKTRKGNCFFTGNLERVMNYARKFQIPIELENENILNPLPHTEPYLEGITLRDDQKPLVKAGLEKQRGVIKAPTGSGKTVLMLSIISAFPDYKFLILAHTTSLVEQTVEEARKFKFKGIQQLGGGHSGPLRGDLVIATVQTLSKMNPMEYADYFHGVIVDEAHHVSKMDGKYHEWILRHLLCPIRLGFTATLPDSDEGSFVLEGLIGPTIADYTLEQAMDDGILAKPKLKLVRAPAITSKRQKTYNQVYDEAIVNNRRRNRQILQMTKDFIEEGKSVLVLVRQVEHGTNLENTGRNVFQIPIEFVYGNTPGEVREDVKKRLTSKELKAVIANVVWREGINIPSLDVIINAAGGKSEIPTLQGIGRGLRRSEGKEEVTLVDFFDAGNKWLVEHFGMRLTLYFDKGWL